MPAEITRLKLLTDGYFAFAHIDTHSHARWSTLLLHAHTHTHTPGVHSLIELYKQAGGQLFVTVCARVSGLLIKA